MKWPKLGRTGKIVRNLVLVLLLWVGIWLNAGGPYPTAGMELRRLERQNLIPSSEILYWEETADRQRAQMVGVGEEWVVTAAFFRSDQNSGTSIAILPKEEGPMPIRLQYMTEREDASGETRAGLTLAVIQTPEDAVWAELDITAKNKTADEPADIKLERTRREDGLFLFWFDPELEDAYGEVMGTSWPRGTYTLRLYREEGSLISEYTGTVPRGLYSERYNYVERGGLF